MVGFLSVIGLAACDSGGGGGDQDAGVITDVGIVADQNFRANPNGFKFENYENNISGTAAVNMTAAEMSRMFGADKVCSSGSGGSCILTVTADSWMQARNSEMNGGHCEGMAVLSMLIFSGQGNKTATEFGGSSEKDTYSINLSSNTGLQREIAYWFSTQYTNPTKASEVMYAPNDFLAKLISELQKSPVSETWDIGFYRVVNNKTEGHAVSPAYVNSLGNGKVNVMVYDNNYPNQEQTIEFDQIANTFKYETATNPTEPKSVWSGDANNKNITLTPSTPRLGVQDWPPVVTLGSVVPRLNQVSMKGPGDLMISDDKGGRLGSIAGKVVNEMPGANVIIPIGGRPVFEVPEGSNLSIVIDGNALSEAEDSGVLLIARGKYVLSVGGIKLHPGKADTISFSSDGTELAYETSSPQKPDMEIAYETTGAEPDYVFTAHASCNSNSQWMASMKLDRAMGTISTSFSSAASAVMDFDLDVGRIDVDGKYKLSRPAVTVKSGEAVSVDYLKL
jgi:hypothetical protein